MPPHGPHRPFPADALLASLRDIVDVTPPTGRPTSVNAESGVATLTFANGDTMVSSRSEDAITRTLTDADGDTITETFDHAAGTRAVAATAANGDSYAVAAVRDADTGATTTTVTFEVGGETGAATIAQTLDDDVLTYTFVGDLPELSAQDFTLAYDLAARRVTLTATDGGALSFSFADFRAELADVGLVGMLESI